MSSLCRLPCRNSGIPNRPIALGSSVNSRKEWARCRAWGPRASTSWSGTACGASPIPFQTTGFFIGPLQEEFGWSLRDISAGPRDVVVVPSMSLDGFEASSIPGFSYYEERMLFTVMLLRHPRARLVRAVHDEFAVVPDLEVTVDAAALAGTPLAGDWTLTVSDNARADTGTLTRWSIAAITTP